MGGWGSISNWRGIVAGPARHDDAAPLPPASRHRSSHRCLRRLCAAEALGVDLLQQT
jgi:hypothetical protein